MQFPGSERRVKLNFITAIVPFLWASHWSGYNYPKACSLSERCSLKSKQTWSFGFFYSCTSFGALTSSAPRVGSQTVSRQFHMPESLVAYLKTENGPKAVCSNRNTILRTAESVSWEHKWIHHDRPLPPAILLAVSPGWGNDPDGVLSMAPEAKLSWHVLHQAARPLNTKSQHNRFNGGKNKFDKWRGTRLQESWR